MKRSVCVLFLLTLMVVSANGQASRWDWQAFTVANSGFGAYPSVLSIPGATISVCNSPANALPCTNFAPTYTDSTGATTCNSSVPLVRPGTSLCVAKTDAQGNFGLWIKPGNYQYTITMGALNFGPFDFTVSGAAGTTFQAQYNCGGVLCGSLMTLDAPGNISTPGGVTAGTANISAFNNIIYMSGFGRYTLNAAGFQNAINDCYARYSSGTNSGGCKVVIGYGNFTITATINILPGVTFDGSGKLGTVFTGDGFVTPLMRVLNNAPLGNRGGVIGGFTIDENSGHVGLEIQGAVSRPVVDVLVENATSACTVFANTQNLRMMAIDNTNCGSAASGSVDTNYTLTGAKAPQPNPRTYALTAVALNSAPVITLASVASSTNGIATYTTSTDITTLCSSSLVKGYPFAVTGFPQISGLNSPNNGNYYAVDCTAPNTLILRNAYALSQVATATATGIAAQVFTVSGADPNFATDCANGYVQRPFMMDTSGFSNAINNTTGAPRQIYGCDSTHIYTGNWSVVNETASATATMHGYTTTYTSNDANLAADCKKDYLRGFFPMISGFSNAGNNTGPAEIKACDWVNNTVTVMNLNGVTETHAGTLTFHGDRAGACMRSTWGAAGYTIWGGEQSGCAPFGILYHANQQIDTSVRYDTGTSLICSTCSARSVDNAYQGLIIENACTGATGTPCPNASAISVAAVGLRTGNALSFIGSGGGMAATDLHYPFSFFWADDVDYDGISSSKPHAITVNDMQFTSGTNSGTPCSSGTGGCATVYDLQQTVDLRDGSDNRRNTEDLLYRMDDYSNVWEAPNNTDGVVARYANEAGGSDLEEIQVLSLFNSAIRVKGLGQFNGPLEMSQQFELGATPSTNCTSFASCTMDSAATAHYFTSLTANLTLNAPLNPHFSSELIVVLTQDGTGGRTVTWNAAFKFGNNPCPLDTTPNATSTYRFINFGSWQLVSCTGAASASTAYVPTFTVGPAMGTSPTFLPNPCITGMPCNGNAFAIKFTTGTATAGGVLFTVTFSPALPSIPAVVCGDAGVASSFNGLPLSSLMQDTAASTTSSVPMHYTGAIPISTQYGLACSIRY